MKFALVFLLTTFLAACSSTNNTVAPVILTTPVTFNGTWGDYIGNTIIGTHGAGNATIIVTRGDDSLTGHFIRYNGNTTTILDSGSIAGISTNKPTNSNYTMIRAPFGILTFIDDQKVNISYKFSSGFADSSSVIIDANR